MASSGLLTLEHNVRWNSQPQSGVGGGSIVFGTQLRNRQGGGYGFGVGAGRWNAGYYHNSALSGGSPLLTTSARTIDLQTQADRFGIALGLEEVVYLDIISHPDNVYNITLGPDASNGWLGIFSDASDLLKIKPGSRLTFNAMGLDVGWAVSATSKVLDLANASSSTQHYEILILGRNTA